MADINRIVIIGRLTRDAEVKYTSAGMAIGNGSIAINRSVKRDGEWFQETSYFDFAIFGKQAEGLKQYLVKGKQIGIDGYLKQDRWQDQNGQNRSKVTIVANDIELLGGNANNGGSSNGYGSDFPEDIPYGE